MSSIAAFIGRLFLAVIFIVSGINKLYDPASTEAMITGIGLPGGLAIPTGIFELVAGTAIALGFMTRLFAILLAGFTLLTAFFFHNRFGDPMQAVHALKNLAITGGLLCLFAHSQMRWSYDSMRQRRKGEIATREAEHRAHEAELRAARAEGRAAVTPGVTAGAMTSAGATPAVGTNRTLLTDHDGAGTAVPHRRKWFWNR